MTSEFNPEPNLLPSHIGSKNTHLSLRLPFKENRNLIKSENHIPIIKFIKLDDLRRYFHLPADEAADKLGICTTYFKTICRLNKLKKWPYRKIKSLTKTIESLEMAQLHGNLSEEEKIECTEQINNIKSVIDNIISNPDAEVSKFDILISASNMLLSSFNVSDEKSRPKNINHDCVDKIDDTNYDTSDNFGISAAQVIRASKASAFCTALNTSAMKCNRKSIENADFDFNSIGMSTTFRTIDDDTPTGGELKFAAPVELAPLVKKRKTTTSLIPLFLEPTILGNIDMNFVPAKILKIDHFKTLSNF